MIQEKLTFVSFEPYKDGYRAFLLLEDAIISQTDPEEISDKARIIYENAIKRTKKHISDIRAIRASRKPVTARKVWEVGDAIFFMVDRLKEIGLQIDGVYDHLARDLGEKRKWFEKAIILRRYISEKELIPKSLNWGRLEKGTRKKAERLNLGLPLE